MSKFLLDGDQFQGILIDGEPAEEKTIVKHQPGQHDQQNHAGGRSGQPKRSGNIYAVTEDQKVEAGLAQTPEWAKADYKEALKNSEEMSDDFGYAAQLWQGEGYRRIQSTLLQGRGVDDPDMGSTIKILDENMQTIPDLYEVYRGQTEGLDNLKVGDSFTSPLYQAASTDPVTAASFTQSAGRIYAEEGSSATIMRIAVEDAKVVVIPDSAEFEVVIARNSTFTVDNINEIEEAGLKLKVIDVTARTDE